MSGRGMRLARRLTAVLILGVVLTGVLVLAAGATGSRLAPSPEPGDRPAAAPNPEAPPTGGDRLDTWAEPKEKEKGFRR